MTVKLLLPTMYKRNLLLPVRFTWSPMVYFCLRCSTGTILYPKTTLQSGH